MEALEGLPLTGLLLMKSSATSPGTALRPVEKAQPHQGQAGRGVVSAEVLSSRVSLCLGQGDVKIDRTAATPAAGPGPSVRTAPVVLVLSTVPVWILYCVCSRPSSLLCVGVSLVRL